MTKKGLPANLDAERFVLGSILPNDARFGEVEVLIPDDFSLERHRRIFARMTDLHGHGQRIDRVTVAEELARYSLRFGQQRRNPYSFTKMADSEANVWVVTVEVPSLAHSASTG